MRDPQIYENAGDSFHRNGYLLSYIVKKKTMVRHSENSAANAWNLNLGNGNLNTNTKVSNQNRVRAVSALQRKKINDND